MTALAAVASVACEDGTQRRDGVLSDSEYVVSMTRLLQIRAAYLPGDSARADSARAAALVELGITTEQLREYGLRYGADTEHMLRIYEAIGALPIADTTGAVPETPSVAPETGS